VHHYAHCRRRQSCQGETTIQAVAGLRDRMPRHVEQKFFKFYDLGADTIPRLPPPIRVELRVPRGERDYRLPAPERTSEDSAQPPRMVRGGYHHDRTVVVLVAPSGKHFPLLLASGHGSCDLLNVVDAKRSELANGNRGSIFVRKSPADKLAIHCGVRGVVEYRDARRHAVVDKVGRLQSPSAVGINADDDDVGGLDGLVAKNKRPSSRPQNVVSNCRYTNGNTARQDDNGWNPNPSLDASTH
jgi:hypothetical protein